MKKSLNIGVFNPKHIYQASPMYGDNVFAKGLEANGYEVIRYDYREAKDANNELLKTADISQPDIFWFGKCEKINPDIIGMLKSRFPEAIFVKWAADVRNTPTAHDLAHNTHIDWFFGTFGGTYLASHLMPQMKGVASIIAFTDSEYYRKMETDEQYESDILWTGRKGFGDNGMRNIVINFLDRISNVEVKIAGISDWLGNPEYLYYINGTKIGVGANSFNRTKYSSDRLGNYMACGTFYLCHDFGNIDEIFKRGYHLDWFQDIEEMEEKIEYYLKHDDERKQIAKNGQEFILKYFDSKPLVNNLLNIIKHSESKYPWDDVYLN